MSWSGVKMVFDEKKIEELKKIITKQENPEEKRLQERINDLLQQNYQLRKRLNSGHYFTDAELKAHDANVSRTARMQAKQMLEAEATKKLQIEYAKDLENWKKETEQFWEKCKQEFKGGDENENFLAWCRVMWAVPVEVLVEAFHWTPLTAECCGDNRQNLVKFCNKCVEIVERISKDEEIDIRTYCKSVAEKYGVGFVIGEDDGV